MKDPFLRPDDDSGPDRSRSGTPERSLRPTIGTLSVTAQGHTQYLGPGALADLDVRLPFAATLNVTVTDEIPCSAMWSMAQRTCQPSKNFLLMFWLRPPRFRSRCSLASLLANPL
jgi:hypothetical protein